MKCYWEAWLKICLGTDIVYIPRIRQAFERFGDRFMQRIYTPTEQHTYHQLQQRDGRQYRAIAYLAGRWAAKEAVVKALGTGWTGVRYTDIEIGRQPNGAPSVLLAPHIRSLTSNEAHGNEWQISLSHDTDYAIATALWTPASLG
jgi:holo-[acyl-carrier protein] synthase